ncbi:MAG: hypothetical protein EP338_13615 [Bacteroidetes bacterium]|nr:MAG: hypothetical protein EP338_13615 [Bacteroidota bacterium]
MRQTGFSILLLVLLFTNSFKGRAQAYNAVHFHSENELISNSIFKVFEDSKGYVWIASGIGVMKYDGYQFHPYHLADGISDATIFGFFEDSKGRIWLRTHNGIPCFYSNGKFYEAQIPDKYPISHIVSYSEESDGAIIVSSHPNKYLKIHLNDHDQVDTNKIELFQGSFLRDFVSNLNSDNVQSLKENDPFLKLCGKRLEIGGINQFLRHGDAMLFSKKNELYISENRFKSYRKILYDDPIVDMYEDPKSGELYLSFGRAGIKRYKDLTCQTLLENLNEFGSATSVMVDRHGGMWVSSLGDGVYYVRNRNIKQFIPKFREIGIDKVEGFGDDIYFATDQYELFRVRNQTLEKIDLGLEVKEIKQLELIGNSIYLSDNEGRIIDSQGRIRNLGEGREFLPVGDSVIFSTASHGVLFVYDAKTLERIARIESPSKIISRRLLQVGDTLYIATKLDIEKLDLKTWKFYPTTASKSLYCWNKTPNGTVLWATPDQGLLIGQPYKWKSIMDPDGLLKTYVSKIHVENDSSIWLATRKGALHLQIQSLSPLKYTTRKYDKLDGLSSNSIFDIYTTKDKVYFASNRGLNVMYNRSRRKKHRLNLQFTNILVNGKSQSHDETFTMPYSNNQLELELLCIYPQAKENITYKYRLNKRSSWIHTNERKIHFLGLESGEYHLEVIAYDLDNNQSKAHLLHFNVARPFWLKWWFIAATLVAVLGTIYFIFSRSLNRIRNENKLQLELKKLEKRALSAQMNPHFIFNALTSIQNLVLKKEKYEAYQYLNKFAVLIRSILKNSEADKVSLDEEIKLIENYLELERLRFEQQFEYQISISDEVREANFSIPSMILQPYVENAIKHGFLHKKEKGLISIRIFLDNDIMKCIITDNGIGRKASMKINENREHVSFGTRINARRIKLMNDLGKNNFSIAIEDLYDQDKAVGTQVNIQIPINYNTKKYDQGHIGG